MDHFLKKLQLIFFGLDLLNMMFQAKVECVPNPGSMWPTTTWLKRYPFLFNSVLDYTFKVFAQEAYEEAEMAVELKIKALRKNKLIQHS